MEEQQPVLAFFLEPTNILQVNYDRKTNLTYIYIIENKGRINADLVVYEFDINNVMNTNDDPIEAIDVLLEEFYFKDYTSLERISNKSKIGRFKEEDFEKFLSFNGIYKPQNMTEVSKRIYENYIERIMLRKENIKSDYLSKIIKSIENEKGFDIENEKIDINLIENNTEFKRINKEKLDERLDFSNEFIDDLLVHDKYEVYISYKYFCEILIDEFYNMIMLDMED